MVFLVLALRQSTSPGSRLNANGASFTAESTRSRRRVGLARRRASFRPVQFAHRQPKPIRLLDSSHSWRASAMSDLTATKDRVRRIRFEPWLADAHSDAALAAVLAWRAWR